MASGNGGRRGAAQALQPQKLLGPAPSFEVTLIGIYKGSLKESIRAPLRVLGLRLKLPK